MPFLAFMTLASSVIVYDFHIAWLVISPTETYAPLPIDLDAVLPDAVAPQRFEPVARQTCKVLEGFGADFLQRFLFRAALLMKRRPPGSAASLPRR